MKLTFNRMFHTFFYLLVLFIIVSVCTMSIHIEEKIINTFAWIYIAFMYAYFFDANPPKILRVENLYGAALQEQDENYLDQLLDISQYALGLMRKIQLHTDSEVVMESVKELQVRYKEIKRLVPPKKYIGKHREILSDIDGFLEGIKKGDYNFAQSRTK